MKLVVGIVLALCVVGALGSLMPKKEKVIVKYLSSPSQKIVPAPQWTPPPTPTPYPQPDLTNIGIKGRSNITNASVKDVSAAGVLFVCDQGLVRARFADLDEAFFRYYGKDIKNEPTRANQPRVVQKKNQVEAPPAPEIPAEYSAMNRLQQKQELKKKIKDCESTIDKYHKQSRIKIQSQKRDGYQVWEITEETYNIAKLELEKAQDQLRAIE